MNYQFPQIAHLNEMRAAIQGRDEFIIAEREWGYVVNYMVMLVDSFGDAATSDGRLRREARGIKFGLNGEIIGRPLHKFFNLNERSETQSHLIDFDQRFDILDKLDGSMIHPVRVGDELIWMTKMGVTDTARRAGAFAEANGYRRMALDLISDGVTPIFEWMSPRDRIVVEYESESLVLTALRHTITGEYASREKMESVAARYGVPVVDQFRGDFQGIQAFQEHMAGREGEEGYIIRFHDGHMLKLKNAWYLRIHKIMEQIQFEKNVWQLILDDAVDDILPYLPAVDREVLAEYADQFAGAVQVLAERVAHTAAKFAQSSANQREYAEQVKAYPESRLHRLLFVSQRNQLYTPAEVIPVVRDLLRDHSRSGPMLESVRDLAGVPVWRWKAE
jgi:RNA ligase